MFVPMKEGAMAQTVDRKMVRSWTEELEALNECLSEHFARSEVRERAKDYLRGLLSETERKNGWQLAEVAGNAPPDGVQPLVRRGQREAEGGGGEIRGGGREKLSGEGGVPVR